MPGMGWQGMFFYKWRCRYFEQRQQASGFVEIEVNGGPGTCMRLNLGHGRSLDMDGQASPPWLGALIRELESVPSIFRMASWKSHAVNPFEYLRGVFARVP